jgi:hypothetical protein
MRRGYLSEYFDGVAAKRLSAVEADPARSNQHEYNATREMLSFMGRPNEQTTIPARFMYLRDDDSEPIIEDASLTLYDSRRGQPHRSAEYRFYFPTTSVSLKAAAGDLLVIARRHDGGILVVIAEDGSSVANQIEWLFGFNTQATLGFSVKAELAADQDRIHFASRLILENIGIEAQGVDDTFIEQLLERFGPRFPSTIEFSKFARETLPEADARSDQDAALMAWMEREEVLFRTLERHLITDRLSAGFADTDDFISYSLSVQNRRKSRVGWALEHHLACVFTACDLRYQRGVVTENRAKPDFLFPGALEYHDPGFDAVGLTMLGVKSTCKDRWRQVLVEAQRIENKHLATLEPGISENQTTEMQAHSLQLVVPYALHSSYSNPQQRWLLRISDFVNLVRTRQQMV